jgi:putative two-component system response regulator
MATGLPFPDSKISVAHVSSILIVDDEPAVRDIMARWGTSLGLRSRTAASADEALATLHTQRYDLAVIDVMMPGRDGLWLAGELRRLHPDTAVVIATGHTELIDSDARQLPIADLLIKPFQRDRFALAVDRGGRWRKQTRQEVEWHARLSVELRDRTENIRTRLEQHADEASEIDLLLAIAVEQAGDTMTHGDRVARLARVVSRAMGLSTRSEWALEIAARFHDVGNLAVPDALLTKPSPLTPGEQSIMRRHVDAGAEILGATRTLSEHAAVVLATHEWFSGGGYPYGLAGLRIPLASRIIAVVDAYDAMTHDRHYRRAVAGSEAAAELLRCRGTQFDPAIVNAFLGVIPRS